MWFDGWCDNAVALMLLCKEELWVGICQQHGALREPGVPRALGLHMLHAHKRLSVLVVLSLLYRLLSGLNTVHGVGRALKDSRYECLVGAAASLPRSS